MLNRKFENINQWDDHYKSIQALKKLPKNRVFSVMGRYVNVCKTLNNFKFHNCIYAYMHALRSDIKYIVHCKRYFETNWKYVSFY